MQQQLSSSTETGHPSCRQLGHSQIHPQPATSRHICSKPDAARVWRASPGSKRLAHIFEGQAGQAKFWAPGSHGPIWYPSAQTTCKAVRFESGHISTGRGWSWLGMRDGWWPRPQGGTARGCQGIRLDLVNIFTGGYVCSWPCPTSDSPAGTESVSREADRVPRSVCSCF